MWGIKVVRMNDVSCVRPALFRGLGRHLALAALLPGTVFAGGSLGGLQPPLKPNPAPILTIDFTVTGATADPTDVYPTINIPKFGENDFSTYGGSGLGFDLTKYALTGVQIQFTTHFSASLLGENTSASPVTYTYDLPLTSTFSYPNSGSLDVIATVTSTGDPAISLTAYDGLEDYGGTSGVTKSDSGSGSSSLFSAAPPNLASYSGTGNWVVNVEHLIGSYTYAPGDSSFKTSYDGPMVWVQSRTIYSYIAIPEPGTYVAAASLAGLIGLGCWRARSRRS